MMPAVLGRVPLTGDAVATKKALFSTVGSSTYGPLDVTATGDGGPFPGTIWATDYTSGNVTVFEAYARWFDVKDELEALVGERAVTLFSLALARAVPAPYPTAHFEGVLRDWGAGRAAMIANHVTFRPRMAVRETAKVFGLPEAEIRAVTGRMPWFWDGGGLDDIARTLEREAKIVAYETAYVARVKTTAL